MNTVLELHSSPVTMTTVRFMDFNSTDFNENTTDLFSDSNKTTSNGPSFFFRYVTYYARVEM